MWGGLSSNCFSIEMNFAVIGLSSEKDPGPLSDKQKGRQADKQTDRQVDNKDDDDDRLLLYLHSPDE